MTRLINANIQNIIDMLTDDLQSKKDFYKIGESVNWKNRLKKYMI